MAVLLLASSAVLPVEMVTMEVGEALVNPTSILAESAVVLKDMGPYT
jgi:hypothetical protein